MAFRKNVIFAFFKTGFSRKSRTKKCMCNLVKRRRPKSWLNYINIKDFLSLKDPFLFGYWDKFHDLFHNLIFIKTCEILALIFRTAPVLTCHVQVGAPSGGLLIPGEPGVMGAKKGS